MSIAEAPVRVSTGTPGANTPVSTAASSGESLEDALVRSGVVTPTALDRATRIRARMESPRPLHEILVEQGELTVEHLEQVRRGRRARMLLPDILLEDGALDAGGVAAFLEARANEPLRAERSLLIDGGLINEEQYLRALGGKLDIPFIEPEIGEIQTDLYRKIPFA
jgi:type IV pilus assembly protein PilB